MPPQLSPPTSAVPSPAMMTGTPQAMQSQSMSMGGEGVAPGPLAFLGDSRKRTLYLGALAGVLLIGGIGLGLTSALRSSGGSKALDQVLELYVNGTKNFTAGHYDDAKKAFLAAAEKAPDSTVLKRYIAHAAEIERSGRKVEKKTAAQTTMPAELASALAASAPSCSGTIPIALDASAGCSSATTSAVVCTVPAAARTMCGNSATVSGVGQSSVSGCGVGAATENTANDVATPLSVCWVM